MGKIDGYQYGSMFIVATLVPRVTLVKVHRLEAVLA